MIFLFIDIFIQALVVAVFIRVILSWFSVNPENSLVNFIYELTEPLLAPFRKFTTVGMFDLSPIVVIILLELARELIRRFAF